MIARYVFDTGALVSAECRKARASRFLRLVHIGAARIIVPLPVIAEWWRGRSDVSELRGPLNPMLKHGAWSQPHPEQQRRRRACWAPIGKPASRATVVAAGAASSVYDAFLALLAVLHRLRHRPV